MTGKELATKVNVLHALEIHHGYSVQDAEKLFEAGRDEIAQGGGPKARTVFTAVERLLTHDKHTCGVRCLDYQREPDEDELETSDEEE